MSGIIQTFKNYLSCYFDFTSAGGGRGGGGRCGGSEPGDRSCTGPCAPNNRVKKVQKKYWKVTLLVMRRRRVVLFCKKEINTVAVVSVSGDEGFLGSASVQLLKTNGVM